MNYRSGMLTPLLLMLVFLNKPALDTAEAATVESLNNSKTYYQYDVGGAKLNYTLTVYYMYDANGNILCTVQSAIPTLFTSSDLLAGTSTNWVMEMLEAFGRVMDIRLKRAQNG